MRQPEFLKRLRGAQEAAQREIDGRSAEGKLASAMASEGYAGGYLAALMDVEAMLRHGYPNDHRNYWVVRKTVSQIDADKIEEQRLKDHFRQIAREDMSQGE